jgi:hypothetical protein
MKSKYLILMGNRLFPVIDSKSRVPWGRVGSIPTAGTMYIKPFGSVILWNTVLLSLSSLPILKTLVHQ